MAAVMRGFPTSMAWVHNRQVIVMLLARAAVTATAGAAVTLAQLNLPSKQFWDGQRTALWISVAVVAFFICYDAVRSVNYALQASSIRKYDNDLRAALSALIAAVVTCTGAPWDKITVRCYRLRRVRLRRRLVQTAAVRAGADVADARHPMRPGEGVAGTAFADQVIVGEEWGQFVRTATEQGPAAWDQRTPAKRYGLTWGQLRRSTQADGVVASPTFDRDGRPDGCILVSGPLKTPDLVSDDLRQALDDLATVLDKLGPPPSGWWSTHEH